MLIAQISDTHISIPDSTKPQTFERIDSLKAFVSRITSMDETPDLIIHSGDLSQNGKLDEYYLYRSS